MLVSRDYAIGKSRQRAFNDVVVVGVFSDDGNPWNRGSWNHPPKIGQFVERLDGGRFAVWEFKPHDSTKFVN